MNNFAPKLAKNNIFVKSEIAILGIYFHLLN